MLDKRLNVRVYGICEEDDYYLVTDEIIGGKPMTKFVGGGLEWGEGPRDTVIREFLEECDAKVIAAEHFYTTDFFQQSAFRPTDQLISVYYKVQLENSSHIPVAREPFEGLTGSGQCFRWISSSRLKPEEFTFPIDQMVAKMLLGE